MTAAGGQAECDDAAAPSANAPCALPLWQHLAFLITLFAGAALALASDFWWPALESAISEVEFALNEWLAPAATRASSGLRYLVLPAIGFAAGLLASISPCVLPMVPLNVAYIGAHEASGLRALGLSARFALGAAAALSILGFAGDLAGSLLIEQRGPVLLVSGLALVYVGLVVVELAPHPFGAHDLFSARGLGPFGAGAAFSLVTTPCMSPLLGGVLVASAANPAPGLSVATLVAFSVGYTLLVFLGGVFGGGLVTAARCFDFTAPRAAAAGLLVACGAAFAWTGIRWF